MVAYRVVDDGPSPARGRRVVGGGHDRCLGVGGERAVRVRPFRSASSSSTSVVVPERVRATTRSYARPRGNSEAANASVSPRPASSRSAAADCAMKYEVPQPTIATRSPAAGSAAVWCAAWAAARVQHSGWLLSSSSTYVMSHTPRRQVDCSCKI
ncbi:hypothetical protein STENM327S_06796 [Streptomyces tendae]